MSGPPDLSSAPSAPVSNSTSQALRERHGEHYRWRLLVAVMVGTIASIMSSTVVNVAIPGLSHQFALGQERAQWVTSGFMVASTVSMLVTPWLLARFGYRATFNGCMGLLLAGGLLGGRRCRPRCCWRWPPLNWWSSSPGSGGLRGAGRRR